jgi:hypothetical protein
MQGRECKSLYWFISNLHDLGPHRNDAFYRVSFQWPVLRSQSEESRALRHGFWNARQPFVQFIRFVDCTRKSGAFNCDISPVIQAWGGRSKVSTTPLVPLPSPLMSQTMDTFSKPASIWTRFARGASASSSVCASTP